MTDQAAADTSDPRSDEHLGVEAQRVLDNRYREAREAGFTMVEAQLFAESLTDVGRLRKLVADDCPVGLLAKILI